MATDSLAQSLVDAAAGAHDQADAEWLTGVSTGPIRKVRARCMTVAVLEALCKRASPDVQRQLLDLAAEIRESPCP